MSAHQPRLSRRLFRFEPLESRFCVSVSVLVQNGSLVIQGDQHANAVDVFVAENGAYSVQADGQTFSGAGVDKDVVVHLGGGDDVVRFSGFVDDDLRIRVGSGNDRVLIGGIVAHDETAALSVEAHSGAQIGGDVGVDFGRGDDTVAIASGEPGAQGNVSMGGNLYLLGGDAPHKAVDLDNIKVGADGFAVDVGGDARINTDNDRLDLRIGDNGGSAHVHGKLHIVTGKLKDRINLGDEGTLRVDGNALLYTGHGNDDIDIADDPRRAGSRADFGGNLYIQTGHGEDRVELASDASNNVLRVAGRLHVDTGFDNDSVEIGGDDPAKPNPRGGKVEVGSRLLVHLGGGDDVLRIANAGGSVHVEGRVCADGDMGHDTLVNGGAITADDVEFRSF